MTRTIVAARWPEARDEAIGEQVMTNGSPPTQVEFDVFLRTVGRIASLYGDVLDAQQTGGCPEGPYDDLATADYHVRLTAAIVPVVGPELVRSGQLAALLVVRLMNDDLLPIDAGYKPAADLVRAYCDAVAHAPDPDLVINALSQAQRTWPEFETYDVRTLPVRDIARLSSSEAARELASAARQVIAALMATPPRTAA